MNTQKQRTKIAEVCGWDHCHESYGGILCGLPPNCTPTNENYCVVPDYLKDLNAMHEAEKILTDDQYMDLGKAIFEDDSYYGQCGRISSRDTPDEAERVRYLSLTAAQRAEAFLRTLNLWEEES